jgi:hypothetical protein
VSGVNGFRKGLDGLVGDGARRADTRFVIQPGQPARHELAAPLGHRRLRRPQTVCHRSVGRVDTRQHNARAKCEGSINTSPLGQAHERGALVIGDDNLGSGATDLWHAPLRSQFARFS